MQQVDLIAKGAEDIVLSRAYVSTYMPESFSDKKKLEEYGLYEYIQNRYRGWVYLPHKRLILTRTAVGHNIHLVAPSGTALGFRVEGLNFSAAALINTPFGLHNFGPDGPSGKHDLRNTRFTAQTDLDTLLVHFPDGAIRHYKRITGSDRSFQKHYLLEKEVRPNGKVLKFYYNDILKKKPRSFVPLVRIESLDPSESSIYASMTPFMPLSKALLQAILGKTQPIIIRLGKRALIIKRRNTASPPRLF